MGIIVEVDTEEPPLCLSHRVGNEKSVALINGKYYIAQMIMDNPDFNLIIAVTLDTIHEDPFLVHCRKRKKEDIKLMIRAGYFMDIIDEVRTDLINNNY